MAWAVLLDDDFSDWLEDQNDQVETVILAHARFLSEVGPTLGRPRVDRLNGSRFNNMKELRIQIAGDPWRVLFAFDPNRAAILLVGGNKGPLRNRWYDENIPTADARYQRHLNNLQ